MLYDVFDTFGNNAAVGCPECDKPYIISSFMESKRGPRKCPHCGADNGIRFAHAKARHEISTDGPLEIQATRISFDKQWLGQDAWVTFTDKDQEITYRYPHDQFLQAVITQCQIIAGSESWEVHGRYNIPKPSKKQRMLLERYALKERNMDIHLIERDNRFMCNDRSTQDWDSGFWRIDTSDAATLVGGNIYFHEKQATPSFFGGVITGYKVEQKGEWKGRIVFRFTASEDHKDVETAREGWVREKKIVRGLV